MRQKIKGRTIPDIPDRIEAARQCVHHSLPCIWPLVLFTLALILYRAPAYAVESQRQLDFYHTHTGENLSIVYYDGSHYDPAALEQINHFLSDFRNSAAHPIDPATQDILYRLRTEFDGEGIFEIISGYRSPETNAMLRKKGRSVAKRSLHMEGKAIDVRLRDAALKLRLGGVGYYRDSNFVHVDSGRVRTW